MCLDNDDGIIDNIYFELYQHLGGLTWVAEEFEFVMGMIQKRLADKANRSPSHKASLNSPMINIMLEPSASTVQ